MTTKQHSYLHRILPLKRLPQRMLKRAFPAFHPGWMLFFSLLFGAVVFAAMRGMDLLSAALISTTGHAALTNSNLLYFLRSWQGYAATILMLLSIFGVAAVIMNCIILLSDALLHQTPVRLSGLLVRSIRSIRLFCYREAVPIVLSYFLLILFVTLSILSFIPNPFEIPGYLRYLVSKRLWSAVLYFAAFLLVCIPILKNPLLLHDVLLKQERPKSAARRTRAFVQANRRFVFREILLSVLVFCGILLVCAGIFLYFPLLVQVVFSFLPAPPRRILVLLASCLGLLLLVLAVLLSLWIIPLRAAVLYHCMLHGLQSPPAAKGRRLSLRRPALVCLALLSAAVAFSYMNFNYLFPPAKHIEAVVHRLGGDLDTENTLEGMEKAIGLGAPALETDIQRTKDGEYVIFHDSTLKRMCGVTQRINELTLDEVRALSLPGPDWEERHIPLLSEVLDRAKGRTKLYLELKGADADEKMAQDVAQMVRDRNMEEDCVLISLNYNLIRSIDRTIPDLACGYLYFFAYGSPANLPGSILLAQSNSISIQRTRAIHSKGKKLYCWTVNSRKTAKNMVRQRVDGIISDRYDIISSVLSHMESRNDYERIMDVLLR